MARRLLVSAACVAAAVIGGRVHLPLSVAAATLGSAGDRFSVFALGLAPVVTGFLVVEIVSLLTAPGRRTGPGGSASP